MVISVCVCIHVKYPYSRQILMELEFSRQILDKYSSIELHGIESSGSRVVPCGRTDR